MGLYLRFFCLIAGLGAGLPDALVGAGGGPPRTLPISRRSSSRRDAPPSKAAALKPPDWSSLTLRIVEDGAVSSDTATLCLVRVTNAGQGTWDGRAIRFEARALREGRVAARVQGRFGGTLGPHDTLETAVGFTGRFHRFEVSSSTGGARAETRGSGRPKRPRSSAGRKKSTRRK
ncbi:MAG: hypothetical protein LC796_12040 [Acidobacteria bacterium]|nr:hypothetical protein [Acidobacteriota bacterium]MCA1610851.1 hypothetical protein [Acidobacteriota bacterium]